jgi:hypothetical protein
MRFSMVEFLYDTNEASRRLREKHNVTRSPKTLRKLRCVGGGPVYRLLNGKPVYTDPDLDTWVEEHLSPPLRNSSERASALPANLPADARQ